VDVHAGGAHIWRRRRRRHVQTIKPTCYFVGGGLNEGIITKGAGVVLGRLHPRRSALSPSPAGPRPALTKPRVGNEVRPPRSGAAKYTRHVTARCPPAAVLRR
jgi:hypothetical protein